MERTKESYLPDVLFFSRLLVKINKQRKDIRANATIMEMRIIKAVFHPLFLFPATVQKALPFITSAN